MGFNFNLKKLLEDGARTFNNVSSSVGNFVGGLTKNPMDEMRNKMNRQVMQSPKIQAMPQNRRQGFADSITNQIGRPKFNAFDSMYQSVAPHKINPLVLPKSKIEPNLLENKFVQKPASWIHENVNQQFMRQVPKVISAIPKVGWGKNGLSMGMKQPDTVFTPTNDTERFVFGKEPVTSWKKDYQTTKDFSKNLTGGNEIAAGALAIPLMGLAVMGDLTPIGGAGGKGTKAYQAISKSKDAVAIAKTLKSMNVVDKTGDLARNLVNVSDPKVVAKTLNTFDQAKKIAKPVVTNDVSNNYLANINNIKAGRLSRSPIGKIPDETMAKTGSSTGHLVLDNNIANYKIKGGGLHRRQLDNNDLYNLANDYSGDTSIIKFTDKGQEKINILKVMPDGEAKLLAANRVNGHYVVTYFKDKIDKNKYFVDLAKNKNAEVIYRNGLKAATSLTAPEGTSLKGFVGTVSNKNVPQQTKNVNSNILNGVINPSKTSKPTSQMLENLLTQKLSPKRLTNQLELPKLSSKSHPSGTPIIDNIIPRKSTKLNPEMDRKLVADNLKSKFDNFERSVYGDAVSDIKGGDRGATMFQKLSRPIKEGFNKKIQAGLSSDNNITRRISRGIRSLFGGAGNTAERTSKQGIMRGGIDESRNLANDFFKLGDDILPDKAARERVWAVLDPELATVKVSEKSLTAAEKKAVETIRQASDLINDTNFSMGKISHETWLKGKDGKYITRAYEDFDLPPELSDAFQSGKGKLEIGGYKQRTDINDWKKENAIKDPFYLASKRIQTTFQNKSLTDYANWVNKQTDMVSDVPRAGYTTLSDSNMWGDLAGKNVRQDVLEGIKGFYSDNKVLQGLYDGLNAYDRFKPRQILKKSKTVYNPATRLGNQTSNRVFAMLNGINPVTFEKNIRTFAKGELKSNGKYARLLRQQGILGTDMTKYELVKNLADEGLEVSKLGKFDNKIASSYGAADDVAKLAALKTWLDRGKTVEEAIIKVQNGFQDYSKVGLLYDIGAKLPIVGKPFVRFQSELSRIIKNSITENPLHTATLVGAIALIGNYASKLSGETPEDKATREGRFGTPVIPFTQIPLVFQTPFGEVNVARMFGMYETAGADTVNKNPLQRASKYLPLDLPQNKEDLLKLLGNDVLTGGIMNQITDKDFRGKSISDPDATKFKPSTLTEGEKIGNRAWNAYHNYQMPFVNDIENVGRAAMGMKDQYGREKTVPQALSKLSGFKVEQFGPQQAADQRVKNMEFDDYKRKDTEKLINQVIKDQASGKIDQGTANKRIEQIQKKSGSEVMTNAQSGIVKNPSGGFSYLDKDGALRTKTKEDDAKVELSKIEVEKTGKAQTIGDTYIYLNEKTGDVSTKKISSIKKEADDYKLTTDISNAKEAKNLKAYVDLQQQKVQKLYEKLGTLDSQADAVEILRTQESIADIEKAVAKYKGYGGFKKPKKAKKSKFATASDVAGNTMSSTLKSLQSLLGGVTSTKATAKKQLGRKVNLRKIAVKA